MLILTEKPSVAKDFANALGANFSGGAYKSDTTTITNCVGHLFELEEPGHYGTEFPIIPGKFDYRVNPNVEKQAKFVVSLLKSHKSDSILIATDADREGEVIARECLSQAGITDFSRIKRFWVSEALTPEVVRNGIKAAKPLSEYDRIAEQGFARQRADWLTGMNFCRYITQAAARKLVVGRVQTAVLSALEQRCAAIKSFKSEKYFEHYGVFRPTRVGSFKNLNQPTADGSDAFCRGIYFDGETTGFPDDSRAAKLNACAGQKALLADSKTEKKIQNPPQFYNLNALQKDAFKLFGYSADKTLKIVQSLYEELKCVSYPRTPSRVMGSGNVELCQKVADKLTAKDAFLEKAVRPQMDISLENKRCFNDAKLEAHHALIPLKPLLESASEEQRNVYKLIFERFFTAFLPPCEYEKQTFILETDGNKFRVNGKKILKRGWKYFNTENNSRLEESESADSDGKPEEQDLSNIDWNDLVLSEVETKEKWTKAPPFFNEASVLAFMENPKAIAEPTADGRKLVGLGTPATRHTFIPKLLKNGYIEIDKKNIAVTELGETLLKAVRSSAIKSLADISATTDWEERLDENPAKFLNDIKAFVKDSVSQSVKIEVPLPAASGITCPICGKEVRRGKSNWYCSGYKEGCKFTIWESVAGAKVTEKDVAALCGGKTTGIKHCVNKSGKAFDCRFALDSEKKIKFVFEEKRK